MEVLMLFGSISSAVLSVSALVGAVFLWKKRTEGGIQKLIREITGTNNNIVQHMNTALICIMRENIRQLCEKCLKEESITSEEFESLICMYESYKSLGGNSFVHNLVAKVKALPIDFEE